MFLSFAYSFLFAPYSSISPTISVHTCVISIPFVYNTWLEFNKCIRFVLMNLRKWLPPFQMHTGSLFFLRCCPDFNTIHETCKSCLILSIYFFRHFILSLFLHAALYVRLVFCILLYFCIEMPDFISLWWVFQIFSSSSFFSLTKFYVYILTM